MSHWRKLLVLSLVVSFYCPLHDLTQAAPGDPDPVFGTETIVSTNFFDGGGLIQAVALLPGEKILAGGSVGTSNQGFNVDFALARYRADGSLDSSFGTGGKQTTEFSGYQDTATGMAGSSLSAEADPHRSPVRNIILSSPVTTRTAI